MKRSFLLLTTALILSGCNEKTANINWFDALKAFITGEVPQKYLIDAVYSQDGVYDDDASDTPTFTGNYLSGRFAQDNFDWETANKYFSLVLAADPQNLELERRSMALAMGAGDHQSALDHAHHLVKQGEKGSLVQLVLALETFKSGDYQKVLSDVQKVPTDGISEFITPLLTAWASAGEKKLEISNLNKNVVHVYHAILIADYLNDEAALKVLAEKDYSHLGLSSKSIYQISGIFKKHHLETQAESLLNLIPVDQRKENTALIPTVANPIEGMSRALFDMASVLYQEYPDSARLFAAMSLYLNPNETDSRIVTAHMAAQFKRYDDAIAIFNQIDISKDPDLAIKLHRQIAELLEEAHKPDQAVKILKDIVRDTHDVDAQIQIGDIYRDQEDYAHALSEYNKAVELLNDKVPAKYWGLLYARGVSNERLKNWSQAEKDLKAALALEPDQPYVLNYLGYSWTDQGKNLEEATRMIEKAVRLRPEDGYIVDSLGWVYYRQGKYDQAAQMLDRAIELSPYDPTINAHLGDAYWMVGRKSEARFQWQRALSLKPDDVLKKELEQKIESGLTMVFTSPGHTPSNAAVLQVPVTDPKNVTHD